MPSPGEAATQSIEPKPPAADIVKPRRVRRMVYRRVPYTQRGVAGLPDAFEIANRGHESNGFVEVGAAVDLSREVAHLREIELDENRWQNREAETVHKCGEGNASDGARAAVKIDAKSSRNQQGEYDQGGNCIP